MAKWTRVRGFGIIILFCFLTDILSFITYANEDKKLDKALSLLKDPSYKVRAKAALVLGSMKNKKAVLYLINALEDDEYIVRAAVVKALGMIKDPRALEALAEYESDTEEFVRKTVLQSINDIVQAFMKNPGSYASDFFEFDLSGIQNQSSNNDIHYEHSYIEFMAVELQKYEKSRVVAKGMSFDTSEEEKKDDIPIKLYIKGDITELYAMQQDEQLIGNCSISLAVYLKSVDKLCFKTESGRVSLEGGNDTKEMDVLDSTLKRAVLIVFEQLANYLNMPLRKE